MLFKDKIYLNYYKPLEKKESLKLLENVELVLRAHFWSPGEQTGAIPALFPLPPPTTLELKNTLLHPGGNTPAFVI